MMIIYKVYSYEDQVVGQQVKHVLVKQQVKHKSAIDSIKW
jgi:hypothetical protein